MEFVLPTTLRVDKGADLRLQVSGTVLKLVGHSENEEIRDEIGGTLSRLAASLNGFR